MRPDLADLISKEEALRRLFEHWHPQQKTETIAVTEAAGRVLAEDQFALYDLPVVRASTMDGVAVHSDRFENGLPDTSDWRMGVDFIRADTGDDFDDAFDAVIAIENVRLLDNGGIEFLSNVNGRKGFNVKPKGADVRRGALLAKKGTVLTALDLAAIGMGGISEIPVVRKPKVSFIPTGSELVPVGQPLKRGQNFDTNSILVAQMLRDMGAEPVLHPIVKDDPEALRNAFEKMLDESDIVLINAGTSKGHEDYCAGLLKEQGQVLFHGVAAVPGRPMSMAMVGDKPAVNLSGPAFAAFYSMDWAVRAMVCRALDIPVPQRDCVEAVLTERFQMPSSYSSMTSFRVERQTDGTYTATPLILRGPKSAGVVASMTANGVYVSQLGEKIHEAGEKIKIELLRCRPL